MRPHPVVVLVVEIQGVAGPAEGAVLRSQLRNGLVVGAGEGGVGQAEAVRLEEAGVFLLRDVLGEPAAADGRQEVGQQQFVEPDRFVAEVEAGGVAQVIVAVGQEQVRRGVGVIVGHGAGGFADAHVRHARVAVDRGQVGAAHGEVFVEQQAGAEEAAVVVEFLGGLQVANRFVDPVLLLLEQRRVKPGGRVVAGPG